MVEVIDYLRQNLHSLKEGSVLWSLQNCLVEEVSDFSIFLTELDCSGDRATEHTQDLMFYFAELKSQQDSTEDTVPQGLYTAQ